MELKMGHHGVGVTAVSGNLKTGEMENQTILEATKIIQAFGQRNGMTGPWMDTWIHKFLYLVSFVKRKISSLSISTTNYQNSNNNCFPKSPVRY